MNAHPSTRAAHWAPSVEGVFFPLHYPITMLDALFQVQIDFAQSHEVFPRIIQWLLVGFGLTILIKRFALIRASVSRFLGNLPPSQWRFDVPRLFGTLALTLIYFIALEPVGRFWPNTGAGFVICSVVFCFALARLLAHDMTPRKWIAIAFTSVVGTGALWFVFNQIFRVTLP